MRMLFRHNAPGGGDDATQVIEMTVKPVGGGPASDGLRYEIRLYDLRGLYCGGGSTNNPLKWIAANMEEFE